MGSQTTFMKGTEGAAVYGHADDPVLAAAHAAVLRTQKEIGDDAPRPPLMRALRRQLQETLGDAQRRRSNLADLRDTVAKEEEWLGLQREELAALIFAIENAEAAAAQPETVR